MDIKKLTGAAYQGKTIKMYYSSNTYFEVVMEEALTTYQITLKEQLVDHPITKTCERLLTQEAYLNYGLFEGENMCGFLSLECQENKGMMIRSLWVEPTHRSKHYGVALLERAIELALGQDAKELLVRVPLDHPLYVSFFRKHAFHLCAVDMHTPAEEACIQTLTLVKTI